jgi:hypothetical protein
MNASEIWSVAQAAGVSDSMLPTAVAVAMAESGGNPASHCLNCVPGVREDSRGLWQINVIAHPEWSGANLYDPATNAQAMMAVSGGGVNWRPWSTFKNGAYRAFLIAPPAPSSPIDTTPIDPTSGDSIQPMPVEAAGIGLTPIALAIGIVAAIFVLWD